MRILHLTLLLTTVILLTACAQDPWKADQIEAQAQADAVRTQAEINAARAEQERAHQEELNRIAEQEAQLEYERKVAVEAQVREGLQMLWTVIFLVGTAAAAFALFRGAQITVAQYQIAAEGIAKAIVQRADINSRLIYLDDGRQFPAVYELLPDGSRVVTDITTGAAVDTTRPNPADAQLAAGAIANRHVGIVAKETRRSRRGVADATALAQDPPIIDGVDVTYDDVKEYFAAMMKSRAAKDGEQ